MSIPQPRHILIVRLTAIGDVVHAMPVACALREAFPQVKISWLVEGRSGALLEGHAAVDEIITAPRHWMRSRAGRRKLKEILGTKKIDVTIDLQGLTKSALAAKYTGAKHRIGFGGNIFIDWGRWFRSSLLHRIIGRELSRWINNVKVNVRSSHIVDANLETLRPLGIESPLVRFDLPRYEEDAAKMALLIEALSLSAGFAMISPGAGKAPKLWSSARFAAVAKHLGEKHALPTLVVWAGDKEEAWAKEIEAGSGGHAKAAPPTSLRELAELARRAKLFIAGDTGPMHIAAALGTPCVALFGVIPASRNGPYGPQHIVIQKALQRGLSVQRHHASNKEMMLITPEDVAKACDEILGRDLDAARSESLRK
ncbi:MAG: glycosyltransferase family 9 protein [Phycisphaeraceae bacterium]